MMNNGRGKIKIFKQGGRRYIRVVTSLPCGEETVDNFTIKHGPCVFCGGVGKVKGLPNTKSCSWCRDTDSIIVIKNDAV